MSDVEKMKGEDITISEAVASPNVETFPNTLKEEDSDIRIVSEVLELVEKTEPKDITESLATDIYKLDSDEATQYELMPEAY